MTDERNQNIEHQVIRWEDLSFTENWVIENQKPLAIQQITSANISE